MLILLANPKGGVGKSTIARHAAVRIAMLGHSVVLADADPQASSWHWTQRRHAERPTATPVPGDRIGNNLADEVRALAGRYRHTVVDAPAGDSEVMRTALRLAHRIIIPTRVADLDLQALPAMAERLHEANTERNNPIRPRVVFNGVRALPNFWRRIDAARERVTELGFDTCQRAIVDRLVYDDSQRDGGSVFDDRWDKKAVDEMNSALHELLRRPQMGNVAGPGLS
jgi:chromosome partitioning protein